MMIDVIFGVIILTMFVMLLVLYQEYRKIILNIEELENDIVFLKKNAKRILYKSFEHEKRIESVEEKTDDTQEILRYKTIEKL